MDPLISVIVPVYNMENYIEKCMSSLLRQTYSRLEIILVDDGSVDATASICDKYRNEYNFIKVIHKENGGTASARNAGINIANGEFLMFVDADDYVDENICSKLLDALLGDDADCSMCGLDLVDAFGNVSRKLCATDSEVLSGIEGIRKMYLSGKAYYRFVEPVAKLHRKDNWKNIRYKNGSYYEDLQLMPYLYANMDKVVIIPYIGYHYLQRQGSASNGIGTDDKRVTDSVNIRNEHIIYFDKMGEYAIRDVIIQRLLDLIITCDMEGWVPESEKENYKKIFQSNLNMLDKKKLSHRANIRFDLYNRFGTIGYKLVYGKRK